MSSDPTSASQAQTLHRGLGVWQATALNVTNMVGIGPFITIPGFLAAMHGPQALVAWVIAAGLVLCDGLVWSELGAALPGSGGSYHFLSEIFGRMRFGRIVPFLFIWQFLVSGTLELASGYIGGIEYLAYPFPHLDAALSEWGIPGGHRSLAAAAAILVALSLCLHIRALGWLGLVLCTGTLVTVLTVIVAGYANFQVDLVQFPADAFRMQGNQAFWGGLGGAMTIAIYDYLGYYNICHLGDEVVNPGKTIPRAVMISVVVVAGIYLTMNLAIIGVVPWQRAMESKFVASEFMEILFGRGVAEVFTVLILWTVIACVFSMTLGYSRIPYAAARNGNFFGLFAIVHPVRRFPIASLVWLGLLTALFCYLPLQEVIDAAVIVRILVQFIGQIVALHLLRKTRPDIPLPFRMWLYPLPSLLALIGWIFLLATAKADVLMIAGGVLLSGCVAFAVWNSKAAAGRWYWQIISPASRWPGWVTAIPRGLLRCLSYPYGLVVNTRNRKYDAGRATILRSPVPVVSVGNLTAGGTGKTPVTAWLGRWFRQRQIAVAFVSRGYGASADTVNDEALVLQAQCPEVPHLQNPDRVAAARQAAESNGAQLVILDDGFQHRRLARDLDVVLVDATNPWGFGQLLPRGLLREPVVSLRRAGLVLITRVDLVPRGEVERIRQTIAEIHPGCAVAEVQFPVTRLVNSAGGTCALDECRRRAVTAFCGIGNPQAFRQTLAGLGFEIPDMREYPDHHRYSAADLEALDHWAGRSAGEIVLCTQKDLVKIPRSTIGNRPLWAIEIGTQIIAGADLVDQYLERVSVGCR
ncbi:MAG: tetraacyldisaccharide 4'-kinase [Planctomycetes bacterium]|nr:tetraacyldisaccharide 4'-kinase [Planctomycetota bacterium]